MEPDREGGRQADKKGMFVVSSPLYCSKCFTLHPLAYLFIPTPSRPLGKAFSHVAVTARRPFVHIFTTAVGTIQTCHSFKFGWIICGVPVDMYSLGSVWEFVQLQ